jgi:hypothetical protein
MEARYDRAISIAPTTRCQLIRSSYASRRKSVKSRLKATVVIASLALSATPILNASAYAQPAGGVGENTLYPVVVGAAVGGVVGMLLWPIAAPMGAGVIAGVGGPEMAAGMAGAGPWGWRAIIATRTLVGAGIGAVAGYLYSRS